MEYFVNLANVAVGVKEGDFFREQVATTLREGDSRDPDWWRDWVRIEADDTESARTIGVGMKERMSAATPIVTAEALHDEGGLLDDTLERRLKVANDLGLLGDDITDAEAETIGVRMVEEMRNEETLDIPAFLRRQAEEPADKPTTLRGAMLDDARRLTEGPRDNEYGEPLKRYERLATIWSTRLGITVTPQQCVLLIADMKIDRAFTNHAHLDSYVDLAAYAAIAYEIELKTNPKGKR